MIKKYDIIWKCIYKKGEILMCDILYQALYDTYIFVTLSIYISCNLKLRFTTMASKYIKGHILHFQSSFIGIYLAIIIYFECLPNYIPKKLFDTGLPLAIYLIFIGVLIDIIHKYLDNRNEYYSINKNERIFIMCICILIFIIIGLFNKNKYKR